MVGKSTAHQRTRDRGQTIHGTDDAGIDGPLHQGHRVGDNHQRAGENPGGSNPSDGTADDEGRGVRGGSAHHRSDLENQHRRDINPFDAEKRVQFAKEQLEGT